MKGFQVIKPGFEIGNTIYSKHSDPVKSAAPGARQSQARSSNFGDEEFDKLAFDDSADDNGRAEAKSPRDSVVDDSRGPLQHFQIEQRGEGAPSNTAAQNNSNGVHGQRKDDAVAFGVPESVNPTISSMEMDDIDEKMEDYHEQRNVDLKKIGRH